MLSLLLFLSMQMATAYIDGYKSISCTSHGGECFLANDENACTTRAFLGNRTHMKFTGHARGVRFRNTKGVQLWDPQKDLEACDEADPIRCLKGQVLLVADTGNKRVVAIPTSGRKVKVTIATLPHSPQRLAMRPGSSKLYVSSYERIYSVDLAARSRAVRLEGTKWGHATGRLGWKGLCRSSNYLFYVGGKGVYRHNLRTRKSTLFIAGTSQTKWQDCEYHEKSKKLYVLSRMGYILTANKKGATQWFASVPSRCAPHAVGWLSAAQRKLAVTCELSSKTTFMAIDLASGAKEKFKLPNPCG